MSGRVVLIVEDSQPMAVTLEIALLSIPGLDVAHAGSAQEALGYLEDADGETVGAVITDLNMPRMDGYQLIEHIRSHPRYARLPIIVLSGETDPNAPQRAKAAGADFYFAKPCSPAVVKVAVEQLVK